MQAQFALELLTILPSLINAGLQVQGIIEATSAHLKKMQDEKRDPTDAEWEDMTNMVTALRNQLHSTSKPPVNP